MTFGGGATVYLQTENTLAALDERVWYPDAALMMGRGLNFHGLDCGDPDQMYRDHRSIRTVTGFIARNFAQVSMQAFRTDGNDDRERLPYAAKLSALLRNPDGVKTAYEFSYERMLDVCLWDRWAAAKIRDVDGKPILKRLPPRLWRYLRDNFDNPIAIIVAGSGPEKDRTLDLSTFVWLDGYAAAAEMPMAHLAELLMEERSSANFRRQLWENGARIGGFIERPETAPDWSPKARERFKQLFRDAYTGSDGSLVGGVPMLEDGMKYVKAESMTSRDAQQIEARKLSVAEVAAAYHVPPALVGVTDNANYSNVTAYRKILYDDTLGPLFQQDAQAWNTRMVPEIEDPEFVFVEHNVGEKLRLSFEEQAAILGSAIGAPYMLRSEGRKRLNLKRLPDLDDSLIQPLNLATTDAVDSTKPASFADKVEQLGQLIRAGFDPTAAAAAVGLPPMEHTGLVPITVTQNPDDVVDQTQGGAP